MTNEQAMWNIYSRRNFLRVYESLKLKVEEVSVKCIRPLKFLHCRIGPR